jgi:hypothetical protein
VTYGSLIRRVALTVIAVAGLGGGSFALAVAGGHLQFAKSKSSLNVKKTSRVLPITGFVPGDSAQRVTILQNRSKKTLRRIRFELTEKSTPVPGSRVVAPPAGATTLAGSRWIKTCTTVIKKHRKIKRCRTTLQPAPSPLVTDPTGLQVTVELCPQPWTQLPGPAPIFRCSKRVKVLLAPARVPVKKFLKGIPKLRPGKKLHLRVTITLPANAGNQLQGRSAILVPAFVVPGGTR